MNEEEVKGCFHNGQVVMCDWRGKYPGSYEAKIKSITNTKKGIKKYNIHFTGYNRRHDRTVNADDLHPVKNVVYDQPVHMVSFQERFSCSNFNLLGETFSEKTK